MKRIVGITALAFSFVVAGCGTTTADPGSKPATAQETAPAVTPATAAATKPTTPPKEVLAKCLKKLKLTLADEPSSIKDRAAVGAVGNLPVRYLGAIQLHNKPMIDVWLADNNADAVKSADALNAATAKAEGVSEVEVAYSNGKTVSATFNNLVITKLDLNVPEKLDKCVDSLNDL